MGRPAQGLTERMPVMITVEQREAYERAAEIEGLTLSDWVRRTLDRESGLLERRIRLASRRGKS